MIKTVIKSITPPVLMNLARNMRGQASHEAPQGPDSENLEYVDFYGNTSMFALETLQRLGQLKDMSLFSLGNKMAHLGDYLALFGTVYHNTTMRTELPVNAQGASKLVLLREDFFSLGPLDIDCVISHAAIHCLNDTRYANTGSTLGWQRPYQAAAKLREIIGTKTVPVIVSIATHHEESFIDNNARLGHQKFLDSFSQSGFTLKEHFFDYLCYGLPYRQEYLSPQYRRASTLPDGEAPGPYHYVIGNYYFSS